MKKGFLFVLILTTILSLINTKDAIAASGISETEKLILDKLNAGADFSGKKQYLSVSYINQIENEFISNNVDISEEQAEFVVKKIDEAIDLVKDKDIDNVISLQNSEVALQLLTIIDEIATMFDYDIAIDLEDKSINVKNSEGDTIFISKSSINQTGNNSLVFYGRKMLNDVIPVICITCLVLFLRIISDKKSVSHKMYNKIKGNGTIYEE